jgi:hypothetical protein
MQLRDVGERTIAGGRFTVLPNRTNPHYSAEFLDKDSEFL